MSEYIDVLIQWIGNHPFWAGIVVFLINLSESLIVVGLFVPGTIVMFGIGALVAVGAMGLWATLLWAVLGALAGDGISYMVGRHYRENLRLMWPFNRHPEWMEGAENFFIRHGAKSVIFGRFVGPVRPLIPAVAGMMGMPSLNFYWANFISAITWAPAYIIPGIVFGTSLNLASQIATRLALILVLLLLVIWGTVIIVRKVYTLLQPRTERMVMYLLAWGRAHPLFENVTVGLLDPNHPELKALIELGVILLFVVWIFFTILIIEIGNIQPLKIDYQVYYLLQELRSHWADQLMVFIAELSDSTINLAIAGAALIWLAIQRHWLVIGHWTTAILLAAIITATLNYLIPVALPLPNIYLQDMKEYFPNIQATVISAFYGFLAVLLAKDLSLNLRRLPYIMVAVWIILMVIANLYLGRKWLSDMVGGVTLGIICSALVGIAYRSHAALPVNQKKLLTVLCATLIIFGGWYITNQHANQLIRYAVKHPEQLIDFDQWWNTDWKTLNSHQLDWRGADNIPLTIQVAGDLTVFKNHLNHYDWQTPANFNMAAILRLLLPNQGIADLPVLPQFHDGRRDELRLVYYPKTTGTRLILRLWPTDARLMPDNLPLWIGSVIRQKVIEPLGLITLPKADTEYESPLIELSAALEQFQWRKVLRSPTFYSANHSLWQGSVLLINRVNNKPNEEKLINVTE